MVHLKIFPAILVSCIMILAGCSSDDSPTASTNGDDGSTEDPIVGTWELDGYELTFNADGTYSGVDDGEFDEEGTWSISGNTLTIDGSDAGQTLFPFPATR